MKQKILKMESLYRWGYDELLKAGIADASLDAWFLLEFVTGIGKASYLADPKREISVEEACEYQELIKKRAKRIPLQHITHQQWFMGFPFYVNEHVLVPRQDTETLVEEAMKVLKPDDRLLDMCTGSGCILISLRKLLDGKTQKEAEREKVSEESEQEKASDRSLNYVGADLSEQALSVAKKNAKDLGAKVRFIESNLFEQVQGSFDVIVSNPPYIPTKVIEGLEEEVKLHDPFMALDGKEDGLYFYREIIEQSVNYLNKGGYLLFEIGYDQAEAVSGLMKEAGFSQIAVKKDLAGLDRVVSGRYNEI